MERRISEAENIYIGQCNQCSVITHFNNERLRLTFVRKAKQKHNNDIVKRKLQVPILNKSTMFGKYLDVK